MRKWSNRLLATFAIGVLLNSNLHAQIDSLQQVNKKRLNTFVISASAAYSITLIGLNELWYKNSEREAFHFFNDNAEWNQVDKLGHFYSSFYVSAGTSKALQWANVPTKKAHLWGSVTGFLVLLPIEILDGFSSDYGASAGDVVANAAGASFFLAQSLGWNEIRIRPKFSFHQTKYASQRPDVLGDTFSSELLKDYNGHTYWLSLDMDKFIKFPAWLNLAVGYGSEGMVYATTSQNTEAGYTNYRQFYLGIDFDLTGIKTRSKTLKTIFEIVSMIRLPAPAVEFSSQGTKFYPFYF